MLNPHLFSPDSIRCQLSHYHPKAYRPAMMSKTNGKLGGKMLHTNFHTATTALEFAKRFHARWIRLYSATIAAMTKEA